MAIGLGPDIAEVYEELGSLANIVSRDPVITGERIIYDINSQATKPFIREHHVDATLAYNTQIIAGDIIFIIKSGKYYMAMNKTPEMFEDEIVEWSVVFYLCNLPVTAHIVRPVEIRDTVTLKMINSWYTVADDPIYGLLSDRIFGSALEQENPKAGQFPVWRMDLYIPKSYGIKPLDRLIISETEYYKIESVESYNYPNAQVALIVEDTRPATTFISGDVYDG
jgi:hypothetical protein